MIDTILSQIDKKIPHPEGVCPVWGSQDEKNHDHCAACGSFGEWRWIFIADKWSNSKGQQQGNGKFCEFCFTQIKSSLEILILQIS